MWLKAWWEHLRPVAVDDEEGRVIGGLSLLQLLDFLSQLILHRLPLLQPLAQLLVLKLNYFQVHFLLQHTHVDNMSQRLQAHSVWGGIHLGIDCRQKTTNRRWNTANTYRLNQGGGGLLLLLALLLRWARGAVPSGGPLPSPGTRHADLCWVNETQKSTIQHQVVPYKRLDVIMLLFFSKEVPGQLHNRYWKIKRWGLND